jgi:hypothetical protein
MLKGVKKRPDFGTFRATFTCFSTISASIENTSVGDPPGELEMGQEYVCMHYNKLRGVVNREVGLPEARRFVSYLLHRLGPFPRRHAVTAHQRNHYTRNREHQQGIVYTTHVYICSQYLRIMLPALQRIFPELLTRLVQRSFQMPSPPVARDDE